MTQPPDFSLEGKVALITGGGRGLGLAMSQGLAAAGAEVVLASRKADTCEAAAAEIAASTGRQAHAYALHIGHWPEIEPFVERVYADLGRVDVLINNAGMSPTYPKLSDVTEELWDKVFAVNLKGVFRLTTLVADRMMRGDGGSIINISTVGAIQPQPHALPYTAAKAGLNALTVGFARSVGPKVRVNTIMAGPFRTGVAATWTDEFTQGVAADLPLQRIGEPSEVVGAVIYLASAAGRFTTGAALAVDGGLSVPQDQAMRSEGKSFSG